MIMILPNLVRLDLRGCVWLENPDFLSALQFLKCLNLQGCWRLKAPELLHIRELCRLECLDGVKAEDFMAWAYYIAAGASDEPDEVDVVERVEQTALAENEAAASPVVAILGRARIPKKLRWSDYSWARALYDLQSRGVELAAFQAWAREASDEAFKAMPPLEPADLESSEASLFSAPGGEERLLESARMANRDSRSSEPDAEVIDGPAPPAAYAVEIVVEVGGRKRAPGSRSDKEGDHCGTSQQGRRRRSGTSPD